MEKNYILNHSFNHPFIWCPGNQSLCFGLWSCDRKKSHW